MKWASSVLILALVLLGVGLFSTRYLSPASTSAPPTASATPLQQAVPTRVSPTVPPTVTAPISPLATPTRAEATSAEGTLERIVFSQIQIVAPP